MRVWVNGAISDVEAASVHVLDHGFTVGDGVFETLKTVDGRPFALTRHLRRLVHSANGMLLAPPDLDRVRAGLPRFLGALERHRTPATFMMCGRAVERSPEFARACVAPVKYIGRQYLERDIANHPERLQPIGADLVQRLQDLVGGIEVDLDEPLPNDEPV